jgi:anti-anti-sigma factor
MTTTLDVEVRVDRGEATFAFAGDIDAAGRDAFNRAFAEAVDAGAESIRLDFSGVQYINSTGIALIVGLLGRARADRLQVTACGLTAHYRAIFEITRLSDFMTIDDGSPSGSRG